MQDQPDGPDSEYCFESRRDCNDNTNDSQPASIGPECADDAWKSNRGEDGSPQNRSTSFGHDQHSC